MGLPAEIRVQIYKAIIYSLQPFITSTTKERPAYTQLFGISYNLPVAATAYGYDKFNRDDAAVALTITDVYNLRRVSHQIKHELDHEIQVDATAQVLKAIQTLTHPLGYCSSIQTDIAQHPFWITHPVLIPTIAPNSYKNIQNLHLTTYVSELHLAGNLDDEELNFLRTLPPFVRSLTLNMAIPEHICLLPEKRVAAVVGEGVSTLILHIWKAMCDTAPMNQRVGIVQIAMNLPLGMEFTDMHYWRYLVRVGKLRGLKIRLVQDRKGTVEGVVFRLAKVSENKKKSRVWCRVKDVWGKAKKWACK